MHIGLNNLPKVVTQHCLEQDLNPWPTDPYLLHHCATYSKLGITYCQISSYFINNWWYLRNSTKERHIYNSRLTGSCIWSISFTMHGHISWQKPNALAAAVTTYTDDRYQLWHTNLPVALTKDLEQVPAPHQASLQASQHSCQQSFLARSHPCTNTHSRAVTNLCMNACHCNHASDFT